MDVRDASLLEGRVEQIWEIAQGFGLDPYPVHFELVPATTSAGGPAVPFGQNLVYDCHAVHTTAKVRALDVRPAYTLAAGLAQTFEWYVREGLDRRDVDFSADDALLSRPR